MAKPIQVLLVEDNPADADLTREALEASKIYVDLTVVPDGEQCLEYLDGCLANPAGPRPDLILLDLNLPRVSGRDVLVRMQQNELLRSIPVVVLTSSEAEIDVLESYDLGANCYITKPVDLDSFMSIVSMVQEFWFTVVRLPPKLPDARRSHE